MKRIRMVYASMLILAAPLAAGAHELSFCGEKIPLSEDFVVNKLMNVIRRQMPVANLPALKRKASYWFPIIERYLQKYNIPLDFKYLPIVESGFTNATSHAGAQGFWQIMPETAQQHNLMINGYIDERNDPQKSTMAACRIILEKYQYIYRNTRTKSWVLTAAAYNTGQGNIVKAIQKHGTDYFTMSLHPETAEYVYKIIAIKELFENPEIYMKGFGRNVFTTAVPASTTASSSNNKDGIDEDFKTISFSIAPSRVEKEKKIYYVPAHIVVDKNRKFEDGKLVAFELESDLRLPSKFIASGNIIQGTGWVVDSMVYVNLGYRHKVQLFNGQRQKGIALANIDNDKERVFLKVEFD